MASYSLFTLITCLFIHVQLIIGNFWIAYAAYGYWLWLWSIFQGLLYLLYPLCGWIAEVYSSNFKFLKWSFAIFLLSSIALGISGIERLLTPFATPDPQLQGHPILVIMFIAILIVCLISTSMYEANAIQFGMDQMIEASSEQLSSFIHWYFWCAHAGSLVPFYIIVAIYWYASIYGGTNFSKHPNMFGIMLYYTGWIAIVISFIQIVLSLITVVMAIYYKRKYHIEQVSRNPLKIVYQVLKYSYHHKYPERRSAFTYWENYIPSRIDLGKEKYGGPFTYEQVEDVKAMLRLLLLMVSLFGFHITGDGYSFASYTMKTMGCPTIVPFSIFIMNPQHIPSLIVLFGVPCYHLLKKYRYIRFTSLLTKMWIGLLLCLVNEVLQCFYTALMEEKEFNCRSILHNITGYQVPYLLKCLPAVFKISSLNEYYCNTPPVHSLVINLSFVIPVIHGLSYILVFMSVLEFICAQSPNAMKGILIGVWYFTLSIKYFLINILDTHDGLLDVIPWNVYHCIKGISIFISIAMFSVICRKYRYRERNEIVNVQTIIEEQYERELLMNQSTTNNNNNNEVMAEQS